MNFLGIIPARYGSTRLEGKPLADICGKPMIQHVYERASEALEYVYVATDDDRIKQAVINFNGNVVMTSPEHNSGTNRCLEALTKIQEFSKKNYDLVINIKGDEPLLKPEQIQTLINCFNLPDTELATLVIKVTNEDDLFNKSEVFVTFDLNKRALYFSRAIIPELKDTDKSEWLKKTDYYKHVGMYAYTPNTLKKFARLPQTRLELTEGLEQNRWLENGYPIRIAFTEHDSIPVDTPEDLERIRKIICK